jgi:hypothetical protein
MAMAPQPAHLNPPCDVRPCETPSSSATLKSPVQLSKTTSTPGLSSLASGLASDDVPHHEDISTTLLPLDQDAEQMYLSLDESDSEPQTSQGEPSTASLHSRRRKRQRNSQSLAQPALQISTSNLVPDTITSGTQCTVAEAPLTSLSLSPPSPAPSPSHSELPPLPSSSSALPGHIEIDTDDEVVLAARLSDPEDEGFHELYPNWDMNPTLFMGQFARANESCDIRRRYHLTIAGTYGRAGDVAPMARAAVGREGVGTGPIVPARVRKRISRRKVHRRE